MPPGECYRPSPAEIDAALQAIQQTWTAATERRRNGHRMSPPRRCDVGSRRRRGLFNPSEIDRREAGDGLPDDL